MGYDARVERNMSLPRAKIFASLMDFGGIKKFMPDDIASCECVGQGVGAVRTIKTPQLGPIKSFGNTP